MSSQSEGSLADQDLGRLHQLLAQPAIRHTFSSPKTFSSIYLSQRRCLQFGIVPVPLDHCFDTFRLINSFIRRSQRWNTSLFTVDRFVAPTLGALHHVLQNNPGKAGSKIESLDKSTQRLWRILKAYNQIEHEAINQYVDNQNAEELALHYYFKIDRIISAELQLHPDHILELYILLFFDLLAAFYYFKRNSIAHIAINQISRFILHVLPLLLGTYRFGSLGSELKDLAFSYLEPETNRQVEQSIAAHLPTRQWRKEIELGLKAIVSNLSLKSTITHRQKGAYSAHRKSIDYQVQVEHLWDLYGFRVVLHSNDPLDCYIVLEEISRRWHRWNKEKGFADYIDQPKENGYQSIHVVIQSPAGELVEIQLRTMLMDFVAEFGSASHGVYKQDFPQDVPSLVLSPEPSPSARQGRAFLEVLLKENKLTINDFVEYLGVSLEHIPIEHYYEGIFEGRYDPRLIIQNMLEREKNR